MGGNGITCTAALYFTRVVGMGSSPVIMHKFTRSTACMQFIVHKSSDAKLN
jgi:hypothetical protein